MSARVDRREPRPLTSSSSAQTWTRRSSLSLDLRGIGRTKTLLSRLEERHRPNTPQIEAQR